MFPYDPALLDIVQTSPQNITDVFRIMLGIEVSCAWRYASATWCGDGVDKPSSPGANCSRIGNAIIAADTGFPTRSGR
jgi:hypothetical protein